MKTNAVTLFLILLSITICNLVTSELREFHLEELCDNGYQYSKLGVKYLRSGIIKASYGHDVDCTLTLSPEDGYSIVLSIWRYSLGTDESLTITDSDDVMMDLKGSRIFYDEKKSFVSNGPMIIHYVSNDTFTYSGVAKVQFTFTQVHDGECRYNEFRCRNLMCLPSDLTCDGHNHCGDNSDQAQDVCNPETSPYPYFTRFPYTTFKPVVIKETREVPTLPIIIIVALAVLLILVITLTVYGCKKMNQKANPPAVIPGTISQAPMAPASHVPATPASHVPAAPASHVPTASVSQLPTVVVLQHPTAPAPVYAPPSAFARLRQSFKRSKSVSQPPSAPEDTREMENYQVPSMYPQIPDALSQTGVDNPEFKIEE